MKKFVVVLLIVLAMTAVGAFGVASAQGDGTSLKAISGDPVTIYAEPSDGAEVVAELAPSTEMTVVAADETGAWLQVSAADGEGFVKADAVVVLNLPLLASKSVVNNARTGATGLFVTPQIGADIITSLDNGTVGTVLGTFGEFAYVETAYGKGWSIATAWAPLPEGSSAEVVTLVRNPELGVFVEPKIGADIVSTVPNGAVVYWLGAPDGEFVEVLLGDGQQGYAIASSFAPLSGVMVDGIGAARSSAAIFDKPDFGGNVVATLEPGTPLVFVEAVDDFWYQVYHPLYGMGYVLVQKLGPRYAVATVQVDGAIVRAGPNDNVYNAIANLPAGTTVVVKGISASGAWIQVALPFSAVDWPYYGVEGWMRDFLFVDGLGNTDLDTSILSVTE
jgi:hypothetical protein